MDYASLVLELLNEGQYPVLEGYVAVDLYYKLIPDRHPSTVIRRYDAHVESPEHVYYRDVESFDLSYLVAPDPRTFCLHRVDRLPDALSTRCHTIKLTRSFLDATLFPHSPSDTFEEEIYRFLTLLNYDVPRLAAFLNLDFVTSTRFLPQRLHMGVDRYSKRPVSRHFPLTDEERACFGPRPYEVLPVRTVLGRLAPCTSRSTLLSLNSTAAGGRFIHHYAEAWQAIIPLAYNPLENPLLVG